MNSIRREHSRASSKASNVQVGEKQGSRPSMIKKAYSNVSYGGSRASRVSKVNSRSNDVSSSAGTNQQLRSFSGVFPVPESGCKAGTPPKLTSEQEAKYAEVLEYFQHQKDFPINLKAHNTERKPANEWEKLRLLSRESMLRYLRASRWDVNTAKKRLTDTIAWRREFGADDLDSDEMAEEARSGKETVLGFDKQSRPLHYMHPHRNDTKESPRQMQFAVWILERCIDLMPPGTEQLALLINFDHKSRNPTSIANAKLMLYILQNHYVERLGVALCINVPWVFKLFWNAIQSFIDPVTKSKCKFDEAIKEEVPVSQLSSEFGGELDAKYNHDQYWPDLVRLSAERRKEMLRRFKEDCNSEIGASEWVIRGGDDPTSPFNSKGHGAALGEVESASESSGIPSSDPHGGENARAAAVKASDERAEEVVGPRGEEPETPLSETPLSRFVTPSDTLSKTPIERHFSEHSGTAGSSSAAPVLLESTEEKPNEEEQATKEHQKGFSQFEDRFKDVNHRIKTSFDHAFRHDSSRKSSRESKRNSRSSKAVKEEKLAAEEPAEEKVAGEKSAEEMKEDRYKAAEADRRENVETGGDANGQLPSATEVAALAGTAGVVGAVRAIGSSVGDKVQMVADGIARKSGSIHVLYFAAAKEAAGIGRQDITLPISPFPLAMLGEHLTQLVSESGKGDAKEFERVLQRSKWSVDEDMVEEEGMSTITLKGGEDVAIIPPVSGG